MGTSYSAARKASTTLTTLYEDDTPDKEFEDYSTDYDHTPMRTTSMTDHDIKAMIPSLEAMAKESTSDTIKFLAEALRCFAQAKKLQCGGCV